MQIGTQNYPFSNVVETRTQTPTKTQAINVQIGPGDVVSNVPVVIEFDHHQVHEGETHHAEEYLASLGASTVKYGFTVGAYNPTIRSPHVITSADIYNGNAIVQIYEGATFTGGSLLTKYNRNRNNATVAGATVTTGVTSTNGTLIHTFFAGAGKSGSGDSRASVEWLLKVNTIYRIDVIGRVAGTEAVVGFDWYEDLGV